MSNIVESKTELQVDVPLTQEARLKYSMDMVNAMNAITEARDDMKDYIAEKKEERKVINKVCEKCGKMSEVALINRDDI